ncbi:MAG: hypothetical protein GF409_04955 [Candidatus Omnitrophica bacterium]|nr:hypothetical protein [Candidatus Omnitrophota bacterium]
MSEKKIETLVFLEFVDEADAFLRSYADDLKDGQHKFTIITFHPLVKAHLMSRGIASMDSFHFSPTASHRRMLDRLEEFTADLRKDCRLEDERGVSCYTEELLFSLRPILSTWMYRVEVIGNAVERYRPGRVMAAETGSFRAAQSLWTEPVERYLADITRQVCDSGTTRCENFKCSIPFSTVFSGVKKKLDCSVKGLISQILGSVVKPAPRNVLALSDTYNIKRLFRELWQDLGDEYELSFLGASLKEVKSDLAGFLGGKGNQNYRYLFVNADKRVRPGKLFLKGKIEYRNKLNTLIDNWTYRGVGCSSWLRAKYALGLEGQIIDKTYCRSVNLDAFLKKHPPEFVLSPYSRGISAVAGELCKKRSIPSLMIPHGSFSEVHDDYSKKDWEENALGIVNTSYEYLSLQTPLIEKFLKDVPSQSKPVVTGPLIFAHGISRGDESGRLREQYAPEGEKIILHAGTPKSRKGQRLFNYETVDEYVDGIASLIRAVDKVKGLHLIVRYRVMDGLKEEDLSRILPDSGSYSIATGGSFNDYLSISDLLASYSSSTIEEALQNDIPVLLYNKYGRYQYIKGVKLSSGAGDLTQAAVYNVDDEKDLLFAIRWILDNHLLDRRSFKDLFKKFKYGDGDITKVSDLIRKVSGKFPEGDIVPNTKKVWL